MEERKVYPVRWNEALRNAVFSEAKMEGITVNDFIVNLLSKEIEERDAIRINELKNLRIRFGSKWKSVLYNLEADLFVNKGE